MKLAIFLLLQVVALVAIAQEQRGTPIFEPKPVYTLGELARSFEMRRRAAVREVKGLRMREAYEETTRELRKMADAGTFIHDEASEAILNGVMNKIVAANPQLKRKPQQILIIRNSDVNAISYGEGTFGVTTGMLSRMDSEAKLAYLLAHEISHYELDHEGQRIREDIEKKISRKVTRGLIKIAIADEHVTTGDVDSMKAWMYRRAEFFRQRESESDSLGLVLIKNAGYEGESALQLVSELDSVREPIYHLGNLLHDSFNSTKVPFKDYWVSPRLSLFEKERTSVMFFSVDSLETHPDLPQRRQKLIRYLGSAKESSYEGKSIFPNAAIEDIYSALFHLRYDYALLMAITAIPQMPEHSGYLKAVVAKILIEVYSNKGLPLFEHFVPTYIGGYSDDLKTVNAFLHNIHKEELGELAFDYMNRKGNFDPNVEAHYYQLWRICDMTDRDEMKNRVRKTYRDRFGKGDYYNMMDRDVQINLPKRLPVQRGYN